MKHCGIDVRVCDIGAQICEVMESHEVEYMVGGKKKVFPVKAVRNLNGHTIGQYMIHDGTSVPLYDNGDQTKIKEYDHVAIETFGSTG